MIKAVIFDKDGTLIDLGTTWDKPTVNIVNQLLDLTDYDQDERKKIQETMGIDGERLLPNTLFAAGSVQEQADKLAEYIPLSADEIFEKLSEAYLQFVKTTDLTDALAPGVVELLKQLSNNYYLALITNDNKDITVATLDQLNLLSYFQFIGCADEFLAKPNPAALFELARRTSFKLDEMVYVGDSTVDMIYGKKTAAAIGYAPDETGLEHVAEADYIIQHFDELSTVLDQVNADER